MALGFDVITIFPQIIHAYLKLSILKKATEGNLIDVKVYNLRDYTTDKHRMVDDYPYGGGPGMVMKVEPFYNAYNSLVSDGVDRFVVLLTPQGKTFNQEMALEFRERNERIVLLCGRYEGIDERVKELIVDEEVSIGDYVLTGGELPALVIIDTVSRLMPDVLGDNESSVDETFSMGLLEYPQYTRPPEFMGLKVPDVLLSGNHNLIRQWRMKEAVRRTLKRRPDLLYKKTNN
ncbi:MAG: tRNA (guanosine(37)-N1)-methyltransferase TrmD [Thermodesulfovibrionales bacterium]|nr:tRNA (guanosine(37)-N1)-methyltransferase TrmD [Thermodesulfovibrionales bacterium]